MTRHSEFELYDVTSRLIRLRSLLLQQPSSFEDIVAILADCYPDDASGNRKVRRDVHNLQALGYTVSESDKPKRWHITSSPHVFSPQELETLAHIREMFMDGHPLHAAVQRLLADATRNLSVAQQVIWNRRPAFRVPLKPAIDYSQCASLIAFLERAITERHQVAFLYQARGSDEPILQTRLDPYEIEFTERHFYLIAFSYRFGSTLMFRIDRIVQDQAQESPRMLPDRQQLRRERRQIYFTYQLPASFASGGVSERFTIHAVRNLGDIVEIDASDPSEFRIIRTLLAYGEHTTLIAGPQSLFDQMRAIVVAMAGKYQ